LATHKSIQEIILLRSMSYATRVDRGSGLVLHQLARRPTTPAGFVANEAIVTCLVYAFVAELRQLVSHKFGHSSVFQTMKD
jgi:hypothetical protein